MEEDSVLIDCHESEHPSEAKQGQQYHGHLNTAPVRTKETTRRTLKMVSNEKSETGFGGGGGGGDATGMRGSRARIHASRA